VREKYLSRMNTYENECLEMVENDFSEYIEKVEGVLNLQEDVLASYSTISYLDGAGWDEYVQMTVAILSNNLSNIHAAFSLTKRGEYAAARVIFRNVYEALIILKTIYITKNDELLNRWIVGGNINLNKEVFSKIEYPISEPMKLLWNDLCRFCHGTVYSIQEDFVYSGIKPHIEFNFVVIIMLLHMNYNVLNRYAFSDNMKAKADRLIYIEGEPDTKLKRDILRELLKLCKESLLPEPRKVLTDFSKVWRFKEGK